MQVSSIHFKRSVTEKLNDEKLQNALSRLQTRFVEGRAAVIGEIADFEETRTAAAAIRDRVLKNLDQWLLHFEQQAIARGALVHWAESGADVNRIVTEIATLHNVRRVAKSKSMVTEECGLNEALEHAGVEVVETDLGEYILQLAHEAPSHIVAPVVHKNKEDIADLFAEKHQLPRKTGIPELCREAREILRPAFLAADMGISGANFLIAETGSALIVTNEGNGRLVTTLPRVHVAITGIEKVVPTLEDVTTLLRLLPRSATGQSITNYVSMLTGTKDAADHDGPEHFHIILVDNGRSSLLGGDMQSMLRCIRCGACMNHCPVYQNIGGHAYGWVYPGPMGSILTPTFVGLENAPDLPNASTLCGACGVVCPVKIPLPDLLRQLREKQMSLGLKSWQEKLALKLWGWMARRPAVYAMVIKITVRILHFAGGKERMLHHLPGASGWTAGRDMPAPQGKTFRELYRQRKLS
ncbi:predicted L-lactate dehydrogenase, iron-sulfur cluster-binding subunit YkgF [Sulfuriferula multivorans]|uniref:Predicted L-lactate dehydrogenase, iron-sulfur cluster-binding subunit YkgF n=1 Tax=Sulfuriferula multivorans TaxID=1559896 RepID=A0A401JC92_9PROT|nr:LutB/LldF family L-lactate oxidation iron-sulfur protein [Sulfuriferula multivorans]GBL45282.1 predicted L-lactate dehydrogenase, iron-sulfur cluster-binding subunit YkgF [Sulfuriferula multivorans]